MYKIKTVDKGAKGPKLYIHHGFAICGFGMINDDMLIAQRNFFEISCMFDFIDHFG